MSMLMRYFVCDQNTILAWAAALVSKNEGPQQQVEARMAYSVTLKNLSDTDVRLLAHCAGGDINLAGTGTSLVTALDEESGPWIMAFDNRIVQSIANLPINDQLILEWVRKAAEFTGDYQHRAKYLTPITAVTLQQMCRAAVRQHLGFYCCYFG